MEFPHLLQLIEENQFDTIYHEHFSYFSLLTVRARSSRAHGLQLFDVEELPTHGGSLRIYARHARTSAQPGDGGRATCEQREREAGARRPRHLPRFARAGAQRRSASLLDS